MRSEKYCVIVIAISKLPKTQLIHERYIESDELSKW